MDDMMVPRLFRCVGVAAAALIASIMLCAQSHARWAGPDINSIIPIRSIEPYISQVFPITSWGNSFRSEWGLRFSVAEVQTARLTGSRAGMVDLSPDLEGRVLLPKISDKDEDKYTELQPYLNGMPVRLDAYATFRLWRLAFRANYAEFTNRANLSTRGYLDLGGFSVGGDFDIMQREWLLVGLCADAYFRDPVFNGYVPYNTVVPHDFFNGEVKGTHPVTVGYYLRYVPPEILGMPVYFETFLNYPVKGAYYASIGASLVFRPQIYRFDMLARLKFQRVNLGFDEDTMSTVGPPDNLLPQNWKIEAAWNIYGLEFGMYF